MNSNQVNFMTHFALSPQNKKRLIFREEATSALATFRVVPLCWSNWNLECWFSFVEEGRQENPDKSPLSKVRTNNKLNPHMTPGRIQTRAILLGGKHYHHCANSTSFSTPAKLRTRKMLLQHLPMSPSKCQS